MEKKPKQSRDIRITPLTPEELLARKKEKLKTLRHLRFDYIEEFRRKDYSLIC